MEGTSGNDRCTGQKNPYKRKCSRNHRDKQENSLRLCLPGEFGRDVRVQFRAEQTGEDWNFT